MPTTDRLLSLRRQETDKLPPWDTIIRGTLLRYRLTCGKPTCRCHRSKQYRHGPYWYVWVALKGKKRKGGFNSVLTIAFSPSGYRGLQQIMEKPVPYFRSEPDTD